MKIESENVSCVCREDVVISVVIFSISNYNVSVVVRSFVEHREEEIV